MEGLNLYQYAINPLSWVDPLGLTPCGVSNKKANRMLDDGADKVTVKSRSDAEQWDDVMDPAKINRVMGHGAVN